MIFHSYVNHYQRVPEWNSHDVGCLHQSSASPGLRQPTSGSAATSLERAALVFDNEDRPRRLGVYKGFIGVLEGFYNGFIRVLSGF